MESSLEMARTKLTLQHLARHSDLSEAEKLLHSIRETVTFLERRIAREKIAIVKSQRNEVQSEFVRVS